MYNPGKGMYIVGEGMHIPGKGMYIVGERMYILPEGMYNVGERMYILPEGMYNTGEGMYIPGKGMYNSPEKCTFLRKNGSRPPNPTIRPGNKTRSTGNHFPLPGNPAVTLSPYYSSIAHPQPPSGKNTGVGRGFSH
jgi:hypothetical protein